MKHFRSTEANKYTQEELRLMKTQDVGYVSLKAQMEGKVSKHECSEEVLTMSRLFSRPESELAVNLHAEDKPRQQKYFCMQ